MRNFAIRKRSQGGFTLVEIAIVLVIIGLLLGGVLKGQELIKNARVKNYKSTVDSINAAMTAYLDRYKALPGDDASAQTRFQGVYGVRRGNGDGYISGYWSSGNMADESVQFFKHLAAAGLIKGNAYANTAQDIKPKGPNGENVGVHQAPHGISGLGVCFGNTVGEYAELVDLAFDDGRPGSGTWRVLNNARYQSYAALNRNYKTYRYTLCAQL